jgi:hypothetical protein
VVCDDLDVFRGVQRFDYIVTRERCHQSSESVFF